MGHDLLLFLGLIVGIFLVLEEQGRSNELTQKLCKSREQFDCHSIINSKAAKVIPFTSLTELCQIYFSTLILVVMFTPLLIASKLVLYALYAGVAASVISIIYQSLYLKKWCLLCLCVAACIIFCTLSVHVLDSKEGFQEGGGFQLLISFVINCLMWPRLNKGLAADTEGQKYKASLIKLKRNEKVVQTLFSKVDHHQLDALKQMRFISFGASDASNTIYGLLSPSCPHCKNAFRVYRDILDLSPEKIRLNLIWNTNPQNKNNIYNVVFKKITELWNEDASKAISALTEWYESDFNVDFWIKNYGTKEKFEYDWSDQYNWCERNNFNYSPVTILNGRVFPLEYNIEELVYFIDAID